MVYVRGGLLARCHGRFILATLLEAYVRDWLLGQLDQIQLGRRR